jgi:hypothetical protein
MSNEPKFKVGDRVKCKGRSGLVASVYRSTLTYQIGGDYNDYCLYGEPLYGEFKESELRHAE